MRRHTAWEVVSIFVTGSLVLTAGAGAGATVPVPKSGDSPTRAIGRTEPQGGMAPIRLRKIDARLISAAKSKDHTEAVKKIRVRLGSHPSKTVWTSTSSTVAVPMQWAITDPQRVAKRIRICTELITDDDYWCKTHDLRNYRKPQGDFWIRKSKAGWEVYTAPYYKPRSPAACNGYEYYRPKVKWWVRVVDPRDGDDLVSAGFGWTVRCSG